MAFEYKGIAYPWKLTNGKLELSSTNEMIKSSLSILLTWEIRQRYRRTNYGSRIPTILEEPNDFTTQALIRFFILDVIELWEPRVEFQKVVTARVGPTTVSATLEYLILPTNEPDTLTTLINL